MTYPLARIINRSGYDIRFTWPTIHSMSGVWSQVDHGLDIMRWVVRGTTDPEIKPGIPIPHATPEVKGIINKDEAATRKVALFEYGVYNVADHGFKVDSRETSYYFWDNNHNAINGVDIHYHPNVNFWNGGAEALWLVINETGAPTFLLPSKGSAFVLPPKT